MEKKEQNQEKSKTALREEEILRYWQENKIFEKTVEKGKGFFSSFFGAKDKEYTFYDGPPFATGTPHYGHILASAIKDVVPR